MADKASAPRTIAWVGDTDGFVRLIDQTLLPTRLEYRDCRTVESVWEAIRTLRVRGAPAIGVADVPALGQTFRALHGDGAYRGERRIRVSDVADFGEAILFYSSLSWFVKAGREQVFLELTRRADRARGFGDFYGFVLVAQGSGEVMVEHGVHPWDVAALVPIVEEAGGRLTDWDGNRTTERPDVIASNGRLHDATLRILQ